MKTEVLSEKVICRPEGIVNDEAKLLETFGVGDVSMQGDLMVVGIAANGKKPRGCKPRENRQLADGSTQGSRHVLDRGEVFDCPAETVAGAIEKATGKKVDPQYCGPVFVCDTEPTANDLSHPEHGNQGFGMSGVRMVCAVVYQRNQDSEEREARARD